MFRLSLMRRGPGLLGAQQQPARAVPEVSPASSGLINAQTAQLERRLMQLGARGMLTEAELATARARILSA